MDVKDGDGLSDEETSGCCCSVVVLADVQVRAGMGRIRYQGVVPGSRGRCIAELVGCVIAGVRGWTLLG